MSVVVSPWPKGKGWRVRVKLALPDGPTATVESAADEWEGREAAALDETF